MQLGPYQLQVFTSLVVILGAAFIALICDLLKGNNEQLRELAIELKVRREEEHKRFRMMTPRVAPAQAAEKTATAALPAAEEKKRAGRSLAAKADGKEKRRLAPEALAAIQRGVELAAAPQAGRDMVRPEAEAEPVHAQAEALEQVIAAAAVPAPREAVTVEARVVEPAALRSTPVQSISLKSAAVNGSPMRMSVRPPGANGSRDWGSLLQARRNDGSPARMAEPDSGLLDAVVAATASTASAQAAEPTLPAGLQDGYVLTRLVESRQPVSGLVVSIGVNAPREEDGSLPANVRALIQSLIGPSDFAAQSGAEEFLLIYPGERGAAAQRRLTQIAQQLWDFQLCSLGTASILFSWGGVEVRSESIDEAIASATERMQETRRGRKMVESHEALAKAV